MRYPIGTRYYDNRKECYYTVIDYLTTRNLSGEIVKERYVTSHELMGQQIVNTDVVQTTIDKALWEEKEIKNKQDKHKSDRQLLKALGVK